MTRQQEARRLVDLRELQLRSAALAFSGDDNAFDLILAASRYAAAVRELRDLSRPEARA